jgi:predicted O-linked N-acetylglucosamine transferase (SPINDLY family)
MLEVGLQHHTAGRLADAEGAYRRILSQQPENADAMHLLGVLAMQAGQHAQALDLMAQAIALCPSVAEYHSDFGLALATTGRLAEALAAYRRALELRNDLPEAHNHRGSALFSLGRTAEAVAEYRKALELREDYAQAWDNLGCALMVEDQTEEAIAAHRRAIALRPDSAKAHNNLAVAQARKQQYDVAFGEFKKALSLGPGSAEIYFNFGNMLFDDGQMDEGIANYDRGLARDPSALHIASSRICALQRHPCYDQQKLFVEQRKFNQAYAVPLAKFIQPHTNDRSPERRLRIGYVSADFRDHVAGCNLLPLLWERDREGFEVTCYSNTLSADRDTELFRAAADWWRNIEGMDDESVAQIIRDDQIDILLDLSLHTGGNRLLAFARKPAPVQATFIGFPGSTGLDAIDYRLTDPYLDPPGENDRFYSEESIRLADSFWCYDPRAMRVPDDPISPLPALKGQPIMFGCLNNFCKVNDRVLELWAAVLHVVGDSRLMLLIPPGTARERVVGKLHELGVDLARLQFVGRQGRGEYLKTYEQIDIGLDTFPYNGHTTSLDSYWMGVPVVTLVGQTVVGRAGWSQLCNLNLKELAGRTKEEFVQIATALAKDKGRLSEMRKGLRQRMKDSPLCDAKRFAGNVEAAYRRMWQKWCAGSKVGT